jgi:hypothetical protein
VLWSESIENQMRKDAWLVEKRRPSEEVRGSKPSWAAAIVLINSVGVVPIAYFAYGRWRT